MMLKIKEVQEMHFPLGIHFYDPTWRNMNAEQAYQDLNVNKGFYYAIGYRVALFCKEAGEICFTTHEKFSSMKEINNDSEFELIEN